MRNSECYGKVSFEALIEDIHAKSRLPVALATGLEASPAEPLVNTLA